MQFVGSTIDIYVLILAAVVLAAIVVTIGVKRGIRSVGYWLISTFLVVMLYVIWQVLSRLVAAFVGTYTDWSIQQLFQAINIATTVIFVSFALFLTIVELKLSRPSPEQTEPEAAPLT